VLAYIRDYGEHLVVQTIYNVFAPRVGFPAFLLWGMPVRDEIVGRVLAIVGNPACWNRWLPVLDMMYKGELTAPEYVSRSYAALVSLEVVAEMPDRGA